MRRRIVGMIGPVPALFAGLAVIVAMAVRGGGLLVLVLRAMPHCNRSNAAQRQRDERHEQNQYLELTGHVEMLARTIFGFSGGLQLGRSGTRNSIG